MSNKAKEAVTKDFSFSFFFSVLLLLPWCLDISLRIFSEWWLKYERKKKLCNLLYTFLWVAWKTFSISNTRKNCVPGGDLTSYSLFVHNFTHRERKTFMETNAPQDLPGRIIVSRQLLFPREKRDRMTNEHRASPRRHVPISFLACPDRLIRAGE